MEATLFCKISKQITKSLFTLIINLPLQFQESIDFEGGSTLVLTYNRHMDFVDAEGRLTGQRDGRIRGEVANHLKTSKLAAHLLHSHALVVKN